MKKKCFVCQIWCNECEISKFSYPHKYSWGDVTASWWQFMHTPFPNLDTHQSWSQSTLYFCNYCPLKIAPLTPCHVTHDDVTKISKFSAIDHHKFYVYATDLYVKNLDSSSAHIREAAWAPCYHSHGPLFERSLPLKCTQIARCNWWQFLPQDACLCSYKLHESSVWKLWTNI